MGKRQRVWIWHSVFSVHIEVPAINASDAAAEPSSAIRDRVTGARTMQQQRFKADGIYANAQMRPRHIRKYCKIDDASLKLMELAMNKLGLSARAYNRILKVARTTADLEAADSIASHHITEAIQYRSLDRKIG